MEKAIKNIIKDMLEVKPQNRPTSDEVVRRLTELRAKEDTAEIPSAPSTSSSSHTLAMTGKCKNYSSSKISTRALRECRPILAKAAHNSHIAQIFNLESENRDPDHLQNLIKSSLRYPKNVIKIWS